MRSSTGSVILKKSALVATVLIAASALFHGGVMADDDDEDREVIIITLTGIGPGAGASGTVEIVNNPWGPDKMKLKIEGLPPNSRQTVFLTRHRFPSRLPAQFIGEFTTDEDGEGELELKAEIVNAFASANQTLEDAFGEADVAGAGTVLGGTANTIPLNWFRGYFVELFPHNVFGPDEITLGGPPSFISAPALP